MSFRHSKRILIELNVTIIDKHLGKFHCKSKDANLQGLYLKSVPETFAIHSPIKIALGLHDGSNQKIYILSAYLVRFNEQGFAVAFIDYDTEFKKIYERLLYRQDSNRRINLQLADPDRTSLNPIPN